MLAVPGFAERPGPFHSHPTGWTGRAIPGGWTGQRFPAAGRAGRYRAAGWASGSLRLDGSGDSRRLDESATPRLEVNHTPPQPIALLVVRSAHSCDAHPSHDSGSRPPADPPFGRVVQAAREPARAGRRRTGHRDPADWTSRAIPAAPDSHTLPSRLRFSSLLTSLVRCSSTGRRSCSLRCAGCVFRAFVRSAHEDLARALLARAPRREGVEGMWRNIRLQSDVQTLHMRSGSTSNSLHVASVRPGT